MTEQIPPPEKMSPGDVAWLISRLIVYIVVSVGLIISASAAAVALGFFAYEGTGNRAFPGFATGISSYLAFLAGREFALRLLTNLMFKDVFVTNQILK